MHPDEDRRHAEDDDRGPRRAADARPARTSASWGDVIAENYLTFDRRTLGFTRILLGFFLIGDLIRRTWSWVDMYSNAGVLPNHVNLWRPQGTGNFSLFNAFTTPGELWVLWAVLLATYFCLLVGFKTKLAQVLSLVFVTSMNGRVLLIENGGYIVHNLLLLWTCFLPLGDRFSVDALAASLRRRRERTADELNDRGAIDDPEKPDRYVSVAGAVMLVQLAAIYFFNVVHKTGVAWKNGTAVHYVLYIDRMVTPLVALVREHLPAWAIVFMTKTTLAFETAIPVCLLTPLGRVWARRFAVAMMNTLHIGFGTALVLGPFSWSLCVWSALLFGREDWELAIRTMARPHRARAVLFDPRSPGALFACRLLARMDRFGLLVFEERADAPFGLAVRRPGGEVVVTGAPAIADLVAALPLGPAAAWALRLPGVRGAVTALAAALHRRGAGRVIGLRLPARSGIAPPAPRLRRAGRSVLTALRELALVVLFAGAVNEAMTELRVVNRRIEVPHPEPLRLLAHKLRFLQGWFMFSPNPIMDDGTIVVDAVTADGRHVDPFTGKAPSFDLSSAKGLGYSQIWCEYFNRMRLPGNSTYRDAMKEYLLRYPERTGRPEDAIVSGDVYWLKDWNPKWGTTESYGQERSRLFSFAGPAIQPKAPGVPPPSPPPPDESAPPPPPHTDGLGPTDQGGAR